MLPEAAQRKILSTSWWKMLAIPFVKIFSIPFSEISNNVRPEEISICYVTRNNSMSYYNMQRAHSIPQIYLQMGCPSFTLKSGYRAWFSKAKCYWVWEKEYRIHPCLSLLLCAFLLNQRFTISTDSTELKELQWGIHTLMMPDSVSSSKSLGFLVDP